MKTFAKLFVIGLFFFPFISFAAIAFDTAGGAPIASGNTSFNMSLGSTTTALVCGVYYNTSDGIAPTAKFGSTTLTAIATANMSGGNDQGGLHQWLYYELNSPTVSTYPVLFFNNFGRPIGGSCTSYSGVASIGASASTASSTLGSLSANVSTSKSGSWLVMGVSGNSTLSPSMGTIQRDAQSGANLGIYDSNGQVNIGSNSLTVFNASNNGLAEVIAELQPAIVKTSQTISFGTLSNKTYGDSDFGLNATSSSGLAVSFSSQTPDICAASSTVHIISSGTCTIKASQSGDASYNPAPDTSQSFVISKKVLSVSGTIASDKVYDATTTVTVRAGILSGLIGSDSATIASTTSIFADKNIGANKAVKISYSLRNSTSNYAVAGDTLFATITPLVLSDSVSVSNKVYDASTTAIVATSTLINVVPGDNVSATFAVKFSDKNVGLAKIVSITGNLSEADAGNYVLNISTSTADISPAPVTITAQPNTKIYDGNTSVSTTTPSIYGLFGTDTSSSTEIYDISDVGSRLMTIASYTIQDGNNGKNYSISTTTAQGIILPKPTSPIPEVELRSSTSAAPLQVPITHVPTASVGGNGSPFIIGVTNGNTPIAAVLLPGTPPAVSSIASATTVVSTTSSTYLEAINVAPAAKLNFKISSKFKKKLTSKPG